MSGLTNVVEFTPTTFSQITVTSSSATLASLCGGSIIPAGAKHAVFHPEGDVRWRADGTDPTADIGLVMKSGQDTVFENQPSIFDTMELIASGDTLVNVHFFK